MCAVVCARESPPPSPPPLPRCMQCVSRAFSILSAGITNDCARRRPEWARQTAAVGLYRPREGWMYISSLNKGNYKPIVRAKIPQYEFGYGCVRPYATRTHIRQRNRRPIPVFCHQCTVYKYPPPSRKRVGWQTSLNHIVSQYIYKMNSASLGYRHRHHKSMLSKYQSNI